MNLLQKVLNYIHPSQTAAAATQDGKDDPNEKPETVSEPQMLARGWHQYAESWNPDNCVVLPGQRPQYLGDEWTIESAAAGSTYGLGEDAVARFETFLKEGLLDRYLPADAGEGMEIGPGGGRLTGLLVPRTKTLHLADAAEAMLRHLKQRFAGVPNLHYYLTDGTTLPALPPASLDYVIAFDVFVHFEPRLVYWYLRQISSLLRPGGTGIIHYANILTPAGWQQFERHVEENLQQRAYFGAFGVMCPQLMGRFLEALSLEVITTDTGLIPRDAVAVFRKPVSS